MGHLRVLAAVGAVVALVACDDGDAPSPTDRRAAPLAAAPAAAIDVDQVERLSRLEARLVETESRLRAAEAQAAAAEARAASLAQRLPSTPDAPALDPQIAAEDQQIKAEATGVDDGAGWVPEAPPAYDDATDPTKAEAYNIDPDPND